VVAAPVLVSAALFGIPLLVGNDNRNQAALDVARSFVWKQKEAREDEVGEGVIHALKGLEQSGPLECEDVLFLLVGSPTGPVMCRVDLGPYLDPARTVPLADSMDDWTFLHALMIDGFHYEIRKPDAQDPGTESVIEIIGRHDTFAPGEETPANDSAETDVHDNLQELQNYHRVFRLIHPFHANAKTSDDSDENTWSSLEGAWGPKVLWLERHMPFVTAYVGRLEFRIHTYEVPRPELHRLEHHEQIRISLLQAPKDCN